MFRYRMIAEDGRCWVDTDMLCLNRPAFDNDGFVFCRQADAVGTSLVNNAVLRLPPSHPALAELDRDGGGRDRRRPEMGRDRPVPADAGPGQARPHAPCARFACLLSDRAGAILEAVPARLSRLGRTTRCAAQPSCTYGARRSRGAAMISGPARQPAPISHEAFAARRRA